MRQILGLIQGYGGVTYVERCNCWPYL